jgi:hypothetical protein
MAALYKTHHSQLNFYVCSSLKQQTTGRHVAPTENRQKVKDPQVGLDNKICPLVRYHLIRQTTMAYPNTPRLKIGPYI